MVRFRRAGAREGSHVPSAIVPRASSDSEGTGVWDPSRTTAAFWEVKLMVLPFSFSQSAELPYEAWSPLDAVDMNGSRLGFVFSWVCSGPWADALFSDRDDVSTGGAAVSTAINSGVIR